MSFCVVKNGDFIFLFDSHSHGDMGAAIHSAKLDHMDNFIDEFPAPKNDLMYTCVVAVEWVRGTCYFCLHSKCFKVEGGWCIFFLLAISEVKILWRWKIGKIITSKMKSTLISHLIFAAVRNFYLEISNSEKKKFVTRKLHQRHFLIVISSFRMIKIFLTLFQADFFD